MKISYHIIIVTIVNLILYIAIIIGVYKAVHGVKNFINRNKELNKKVDTILNKLDNKSDN